MLKYWISSLFLFVTVEASAGNLISSLQSQIDLRVSIGSANLENCISHFQVDDPSDGDSGQRFVSIQYLKDGNSKSARISMADLYSTNPDEVDSAIFDLKESDIYYKDRFCSSQNPFGAVTDSNPFETPTAD